MHVEPNFARVVNFNHGPGIKKWIVIENQHTITAGRILQRHKFNGFTGKIMVKNHQFTFFINDRSLL